MTRPEHPIGLQPVSLHHGNCGMTIEANRDTIRHLLERLGLRTLVKLIVETSTDTRTQNWGHSTDRDVEFKTELLAGTIRGLCRHRGQ